MGATARTGGLNRLRTTAATHIRRILQRAERRLLRTSAQPAPLPQQFAAAVAERAPDQPGAPGRQSGLPTGGGRRFRGQAPGRRRGAPGAPAQGRSPGAQISAASMELAARRLLAVELVEGRSPPSTATTIGSTPTYLWVGAKLRTNYGPRRPNSAHLNGQPWTPASSDSRSTTMEARSGGQGVASSNLASPTKRSA